MIQPNGWRSLRRLAANRRACIAESDALLSAHQVAGAFLETPATKAADPQESVGTPACRDPYQSLSDHSTPWRRRHGRSLPGRSTRTGSAAGSAKLIKPGLATEHFLTRFETERQTLRDDGSSQHRQSVRCRNDRAGAALLCHGAGCWKPHHRVLRQPRSGLRERLEFFMQFARPCSMLIRKGSSIVI